mgnify:CR=1 FL=1
MPVDSLQFSDPHPPIPSSSKPGPFDEEGPFLAPEYRHVAPPWIADVTFARNTVTSVTLAAAAVAGTVQAMSRRKHLQSPLPRQTVLPKEGGPVTNLCQPTSFARRQENDRLNSHNDTKKYVEIRAQNRYLFVRQESIMRNVLKIQLAGALAQRLRPVLDEISVVHLVSSRIKVWTDGATPANLILVDYHLWMDTERSTKVLIRNQLPAVVVVLVADVADEERALKQINVDADDYLLPEASAAEVARTIRHARHRRSLMLLLHDTQRKLARSHARSARLLSDGTTHRMSSAVGGETPLVRPTRRETAVFEKPH